MGDPSHAVVGGYRRGLIGTNQQETVPYQRGSQAVPARPTGKLVDTMSLTPLD
ncbi:MAG: hypothetical protein ACE5JQ_02945 [Candidatus Methylomirabilales bacterium]